MASDRTLRTVRCFIWQQFRVQGVRMFALPVGLAVVFIGINVVAAQSPGSLTGTTQKALSETISRYFSDVSGSEAVVLALLFVQGPYLLTVFGAVLGARVGQGVTQPEIESGRFELLLASPYCPAEVFKGLVLGAFTITMLQLGVLAVVALGSTFTLLLSLGASPTGNLGTLAYTAFLIPLPGALWATLVMVVVSLGVGETYAIGGLADLAQLVAIAPAVGGLLVVNIFPTINIYLLSVGMLVVSVLATVIGAGAISRWFRPERVLR